MTRGRRGAVLLEALVALLVLATVGLAAATLQRQAGAVLSSADVAVTDLMRASDVLEVASLWPREDLVRHLGDTREGMFTLRVSAAGNDVFHLAVWRHARQLLETDVFRSMRRP
jgi:hypothetical protein